MGVFDSLLNNTFSVSRVTRTSDGMGGWSISYTPQDDVLGRMRPATTAERTIAQQQQRELTHVLYVRATSDVQRGDLVTGDGVTVEVLGVREPSRADHHDEIDCREVQQEETT